MLAGIMFEDFEKIKKSMHEGVSDTKPKPAIA